MFSVLRLNLTRSLGYIVSPLISMTPMGVYDPGDVFVVGFPKSGNTWFQYLLGGLLYGIDASRAPDSLIQDVVPDVHFRQSYRRYQNPTFFKSHSLPRKEYRRVIYLVRDGRDAMVSFFHHHNALLGHIEFSELVKSGHGLPSKWHQHVDSWAANPYGAEMITIRYEDAKKDILNELRRVCAFGNINIDEVRLSAAAELASLENMKARETRLGWDHPIWPKDKPFVRRGKVGSFIDEMPRGALDLFVKEAEPTLRRLNYIS